MTNQIIELHDSTLASITQESNSVIVHFLASYIHTSKLTAGINAGTGWRQEAKLTIKHGSIEGKSPLSKTNIVDGNLAVGSIQNSNSIPIPLNTSEPVRLDLDLVNGSHITVSGVGAVLKMIGEPQFIEDFVP